MLQEMYEFAAGEDAKSMEFEEEASDEIPKRKRRDDTKKTPSAEVPTGVDTFTRTVLSHRK